MLVLVGIVRGGSNWEALVVVVVAGGSVGWCLRLVGLDSMIELVVRTCQMR